MRVSIHINLDKRLVKPLRPCHLLRHLLIIKTNRHEIPPRRELYTNYRPLRLLRIHHNIQTRLIKLLLIRPIVHLLRLRLQQQQNPILHPHRQEVPVRVIGDGGRPGPQVAGHEDGSAPDVPEADGLVVGDGDEEGEAGVAGELDLLHVGVDEEGGVAGDEALEFEVVLDHLDGAHGVLGVGLPGLDDLAFEDVAGADAEEEGGHFVLVAAVDVERLDAVGADVVEVGSWVHLLHIHGLEQLNSWTPNF